MPRLKGLKASEHSLRLLKETRTTKGITVEQISIRLDISTKTIYRIENGGAVSPQIFQKYCHFLGLNYENIADSFYHINDNNVTLKQKIPIDVSSFIGRTEEGAHLINLIQNEKRKLIAICGVPGIGKTWLLANIANRIGKSFNYVKWFSLNNNNLNKLSLNECLNDILIDFQKLPLISSNDENKLIQQCLNIFQENRCLVVFDEIENLFEHNKPPSTWIEEYKNYGYFIQKIGETSHQSCLLLSSIESPKEIFRYNGYLFYLKGLNPLDSITFLKESKYFSGSEEGIKELITLYGGNPLLIKYAAETIHKLFNRNIIDFLNQENYIFFEHIETTIIDRQYERLTEAEKYLMFICYIFGKVNVEQEISSSYFSMERHRMLEAIRSLEDRSLLTKINEKDYELSPLFKNYVLERLVDAIYNTASNQQDNMNFHIKPSNFKIAERYQVGSDKINKWDAIRRELLILSRNEKDPEQTILNILDMLIKLNEKKVEIN